MKDSDIKNKQLGTTTYLIDTLALRVGNEKGDDEADTVGCCSLRVEHVKLEDDDYLSLDFLGKDSMRYENTVKITHLVWENINLFLKGKKPKDDLFDKIDASSLNDYLKSQMDGLTAKVFRTYNASITLQNELNKRKLDKMTLEEKVDEYNRANKQVAILCNHQKTASKKTKEGIEKKEEVIEAQKEYLKELEKHETMFKKKAKIDREPITVEFEGVKPLVKKYPDSKEATATAVKKLNEKINKEESKFVFNFREPPDKKRKPLNRFGNK